MQLHLSLEGLEFNCIVVDYFNAAWVSLGLDHWRSWSKRQEKNCSECNHLWRKPPEMRTSCPAGQCNPSESALVSLFSEFVSHLIRLKPQLQGLERRIMGNGNILSRELVKALCTASVMWLIDGWRAISTHCCSLHKCWNKQNKGSGDLILYTYFKA